MKKYHNRRCNEPQVSRIRCDDLQNDRKLLSTAKQNYNSRKMSLLYPSISDLKYGKPYRAKPSYYQSKSIQIPWYPQQIGSVNAHRCAWISFSILWHSLIINRKVGNKQTAGKKYVGEEGHGTQVRQWLQYPVLSSVSDNPMEARLTLLTFTYRFRREKNMTS